MENVYSFENKWNWIVNTYRPCDDLFLAALIFSTAWWKDKNKKTDEWDINFLENLFYMTFIQKLYDITIEIIRRINLCHSFTVEPILIHQKC